MIYTGVIGVPETAASYRVVAARILDAERRIVRTYATLYQTLVKQAASSGPPGPRKITGKYVRSIRRRSIFRATTSAYEVYTEAPQARRLEFGFVGVDSLGRHYAQAPRPHWYLHLSRVENEMYGALVSMITLQDLAKDLTTFGGVNVYPSAALIGANDE